VPLLALTFVALGVSADAFAVAVGKGLAMRRLDRRAAGSIAACFGASQALMPLVGWAIGSQLAHAVTGVDHWVAFGLLGAAGAKMLRDAFDDGDDEPAAGLGRRELAVLSAATSVDALAVGISFAFLPVPIVSAVLLIGSVTAAVALCGVHLGHRAGARWRRPAEVLGGVILVLIGLRVLLDHTGVL